MIEAGKRRQRVAIIDDDPSILELIASKFELAGYEVQTADSGQKALDLIAASGLPHLAIVDINMPGMSGFEFCEAVLRFSDLPIIILTAMHSEDMVIKGIEQYAEDYITKPFSPRELVARAQRILRRMGNFGYALDPITRVDDNFAVDFARQQAQVRGKTVNFTPTETKLLYILMRNAGHVVTNEFLLRRLWPMAEIFEDTLRVHVRRLRQKIESDPSQPTYVLTERGTGYRFRANP